MKKFKKSLNRKKTRVKRGFVRIKKSTPSKKMIAYYKSNRWIAFAKAVRDHWGNRCAICNRKGLLDVHHRTYVRLGKELLTDVIPLCRKPCHNFADKRRKISYRKENRK